MARWDAGDAVEVVQCAGFDGIAPGSFTHAVICGMGGDTISGILSAAPWTKDARYTLILQAETAARRLRTFLYGHGYAIREEIAVMEGGRVYTVMEVRGGTDQHGGDPLYERVSAPLLARHDEAARQYVARAKKSRSCARCAVWSSGGTAYQNAEVLLARIDEWEGQNA